MFENCSCLILVSCLEVYKKCCFGLLLFVRVRVKIVLVVFKMNFYRICLCDNGRFMDGNINWFNCMKGRKKCVDD